ncbi:hypothetical protein BV011_00422 [Haemophilus influenzae]|nr:hypothetical protein BV011_00422 [Haemophilus influenzae]
MVHVEPYFRCMRRNLLQVERELQICRLLLYLQVLFQDRSLNYCGPVNIRVVDLQELHLPIRHLVCELGKQCSPLHFLLLSLCFPYKNRLKKLYHCSENYSVRKTLRINAHEALLHHQKIPHHRRIHRHLHSGLQNRCPNHHKCLYVFLITEGFLFVAHQ